MPFWTQGVTESKCTPATFPARPPRQWLSVGCTVVCFWRTAKTDFLAACVAAVACLRTGLVLPFTCLLSCLARGSCLGRGLWTRRNFPDVWYKSKKKEISLYHRTCLDVLPLCCSRLTRSSNRCTRFGGWAGLNAPDDSVWKSPQVMTHLVE